MEQGLSIQIDDIVIVGIVVVIGAALGFVLQRGFQWRRYPLWILLVALAAGIAFNAWLTHAVQPRF